MVYFLFTAQRTDIKEEKSGLTTQLGGALFVEDYDTPHSLCAYPGWADSAQVKSCVQSGEGLIFSDVTTISDFT